jgi:L-iditol 2-dehydrogenase
MTSARKAVCVSPHKIKLRRVEVGEPAPGWVNVRVRNCGICGSDLHFYRGDFPPPRDIAMGHEISGEVAEVGAGVANVSPGDRVVVEPLVVCGSCAYCKSGSRHLCPDRQLIGTALDGGFAEYIAVPGYALHQLPAAVPFHVGALAEPLAVCVHGLRLVQLEGLESILILGAGTIGLLSVVVARELGAANVAITARHPHQVQLARDLGASDVFSSEAVQEVSDYARRHPVDVVVETVGGGADTLATALSVVRPGGRISVLGVFTKPVKLHPLPMILNEVSMVGSLTYGSAQHTSDFASSLAILERRWNDVERLVTSRRPLVDTEAAFEEALDKSGGGVKVTIEP